MAFGVLPSSSCQKAIKLMTGEKKNTISACFRRFNLQQKNIHYLQGKGKKKSGIFLVNLYLGDKI